MKFLKFCTQYYVFYAAPHAYSAGPARIDVKLLPSEDRTSESRRRPNAPSRVSSFLKPSSDAASTKIKNSDEEQDVDGAEEQSVNDGITVDVKRILLLVNPFSGMFPLSLLYRSRVLYCGLLLDDTTFFRPRRVTCTDTED